MRHITRPFAAVAECTITYDGRASSKLECGTYLVIHKRDGSLQIHGESKIQPLNYQPAGGKLMAKGRKVTLVRKKETITIEIDKILSLVDLSGLSEHRPKVVRTEKEIVDRLFNNLGEYMPDVKAEKIEREARTEFGPCDLLVTDDSGVRHVVEAKRKPITVSAMFQLRKYLESMATAGLRAKGYVAGPAILENASLYASRHGIEFLRVEHSA